MLHMARLHALEDDSSEIPASGTSSTKVQPARMLSRERDVAAQGTSRTIAIACAATCGPSAIARKLGVSRTHVQRWLDPEHDAALTLRDLRCAPKEFRRAVLQTELAMLDERPEDVAERRRALEEKIRTITAQCNELIAEVRRV